MGSLLFYYCNFISIRIFIVSPVVKTGPQQQQSARKQDRQRQQRERERERQRQRERQRERDREEERRALRIQPNTIQYIPI